MFICQQIFVALEMFRRGTNPVLNRSTISWVQFPGNSFNSHLNFGLSFLEIPELSRIDHVQNLVMKMSFSLDGWQCSIVETGMSYQIHLIFISLVLCWTNLTEIHLNQKHFFILCQSQVITDQSVMPTEFLLWIQKTHLN